MFGYDKFLRETAKVKQKPVKKAHPINKGRAASGSTISKVVNNDTFRKDTLKRPYRDEEEEEEFEPLQRRISIDVSGDEEEEEEEVLVTQPPKKKATTKAAKAAVTKPVKAAKAVKKPASATPKKKAAPPKKAASVSNDVAESLLFSGLPSSVSSAELVSLFDDTFDVTDCEFDQATGFYHCKFSSAGQAQRAKDSLQGTTIQGKALKMILLREKTADTGKSEPAKTKKIASTTSRPSSSSSSSSSSSKSSSSSSSRPSWASSPAHTKPANKKQAEKRKAEPQTELEDAESSDMEEVPRPKKKAVLKGKGAATQTRSAGNQKKPQVKAVNVQSSGEDEPEEENGGFGTDDEEDDVKFQISLAGALEADKKKKKVVAKGGKVLAGVGAPNVAVGASEGKATGKKQISLRKGTNGASTSVGVSVKKAGGFTINLGGAGGGRKVSGSNGNQEDHRPNSRGANTKKINLQRKDSGSSDGGKVFVTLPAKSRGKAVALNGGEKFKTKMSFTVKKRA
mmetsp:Transcript_21748/g.43145  ORF Transcript_21748/g.43145 Transcript_21748/m.43145 type:complete len:511 (-) Transcript_21748:146-1678(-)